MLSFITRGMECKAEMQIVLNYMQDWLDHG